MALPRASASTSLRAEPSSWSSPRSSSLDMASAALRSSALLGRAASSPTSLLAEGSGSDAMIGL
jgi:hypothetical protein